MTYDGANRKLKAEETKRKIYQSAEELFAKEDPKNVSVDTIVKLAGVSKGSFYVHFTSKDALLSALITENVFNLDNEYEHYLDSLSENIPASAMLLSLIGKIAEILTEKIGADKMKAVYKYQLAGDFDVDIVVNYNRNIYSMFRRILERGIDNGEFSSKQPPDILARHMMMAIRGVTLEWCVRSPDFDYKTEALKHFSLILNGLIFRV